MRWRKKQRPEQWTVETLKAPADDLMRAADTIRRTLCYGGSGHYFYAAIADWFEREAAQASRVVWPDMYGEADEHAVRAARAFLGHRPTGGDK